MGGDRSKQIILFFGPGRAPGDLRGRFRTAPVEIWPPRGRPELLRNPPPSRQDPIFWASGRPPRTSESCPEVPRDLRQPKSRIKSRENQGKSSWPPASPPPPPCHPPSRSPLGSARPPGAFTSPTSQHQFGTDNASSPKPQRPSQLTCILRAIYFLKKIVGRTFCRSEGKPFLT